MNIIVLSGLLMVIVLVILLCLGTPIAVTIGLSSIAGILPTLAFEPALITAAQRTFSSVSVFTLLAIPFFIFAGNIMNRGGIAQKLINLANLILGRIPGGLALSNILANMMFGSVSGSGLAAASAMGSVIGSEEKRANYDINYSAATNIASAPTGLLIPPSNVLITYSLISGGTSVAALFIAGYLPGILWGLACMIIAFIIARKRGYVGKARPSLKESGKIVLEAIPPLFLIVLIVGGILSGMFTATEASCMAVVYSLILSIFYRNMTLKDFLRIALDSAQTTGIIMLLVGTSGIMVWVLSFTGIPQIISSAILGLTESKILILLLMNLILLVVGTFMDITPAVLIFTPIFLPICLKMGMHPVHFGIMITYNLCIGGITPPVGNILYLGAHIGGTTVEKVMPELVKYYIGILIVLLMVTFIPEISMILPNMAGLIK
ncbi:MAG: TRAP transporter large permease [Peptoniphilaceae bacterium]|nr:TRAP transporter large permease [Peptoniphilaceae bacterium]